MVALSRPLQGHGFFLRVPRPGAVPLLHHTALASVPPPLPARPPFSP